MTKIITGVMQVSISFALIVGGCYLLMGMGVL